MAFVAAIPAIATALGAGTAASGALAAGSVGAFTAASAGTASAASTLGTVASIAGTAFSAISAFSASRYQAKILERNAEIENQNAVLEASRGQIEQQEADFNALFTIGRAEAEQGASGFSTTSSSLARRRRLNQVLARSDALRIRQDSALEVRNAQTRAGGFKAQAKGARMEGAFALGAGALGIGDTLINRASLVNSQRARRINTVGA